jgi:hypothetical protein
MMTMATAQALLYLAAILLLVLAALGIPARVSLALLAAACALLAYSLPVIAGGFH